MEIINYLNFNLIQRLRSIYCQNGNSKYIQQQIF